jgi:hypothetical protein
MIEKLEAEFMPFLAIEIVGKQLDLKSDTWHEVGDFSHLSLARPVALAG